MTDTPRDGTSTSLPLYPLFTCKSTHTHTRHTAKYSRSYLRTHLSCTRRILSELPGSLWRYRSSSYSSFRPWVQTILLSGARRLCLPFRIKGRGSVRAQHEPHVRDTQMNMCQRHGNESGTRGAWEHAILIRAVIKPCQEKEAIPQLPSALL